MSEIIEVKAGIEAENEKFAAEVRKLLRQHHVRLINLMASPGAGKTSLLEQTIDGLRGAYRVAVLEADVDADVDAKRIEAQTKTMEATANEVADLTKAIKDMLTAILQLMQAVNRNEVDTNAQIMRGI